MKSAHDDHFDGFFSRGYARSIHPTYICAHKRENLRARDGMNCEHVYAERVSVTHRRRGSLEKGIFRRIRAPSSAIKTPNQKTLADLLKKVPDIGTSRRTLGAHHTDAREYEFENVIKIWRTVIWWSHIKMK